MKLIIFFLLGTINAFAEDPRCLEDRVRLMQNAVAKQVICNTDRSLKECQQSLSWWDNPSQTTSMSVRRTYNKSLSTGLHQPPAPHYGPKTQMLMRNSDVKKLVLTEPKNAKLIDEITCENFIQTYKNLNPEVTKTDCAAKTITVLQEPRKKERKISFSRPAAADWVYATEASQCCTGQKNSQALRPDASVCAQYKVHVVDSKTGKGPPPGSKPVTQ